MQITIEYLVQFLGELLKVHCSDSDKVKMIEAMHHAALNHLPKQNGLTEKKVGKEERKEAKEREKAQKKRNVKEKKKKEFSLWLRKQQKRHSQCHT